MTQPALTALWTSVAPEVANHLWQSTLFAAVAGLLALALRKNQARARYWIWMAASLKFLIPFSLLMTVGSYLATPRTSAPAQTAVYSAIEEVGQPFAQPEAQVVYQVAPSTTRSAPVHLIPALLVAAWLIGVTIVLGVWAASWIRVSMVMRKAVPLEEGRELDALRLLEPIGGHRQIKLLLSRNWMEPGIFGIFRPALIWPEGISQHLDDRHIEAILAHEICHVRRHDNLTAVIHMLVEAIFWFHPLVWWVGARLEEERERACDEAVILLCGKPHVYAESILKVCKFCSEVPLACISGITGADLKKRVMQIMTNGLVHKLDFGKKLLLLAVGLLAVSVPIMLGQAKAARRMAFAALKVVPAPFRAAAHAIIPEEATPSTGLIAEAQASTGEITGTGADAAIADAATGPAFEVASIRPAAPAGNNGSGSMGVLLTPSGRVNVMRQPVQSLVYFAYLPHMGTGLVQGGPDWVSSQEFDINAKVDDAEVATWGKLSDAQRRDRIRPMMRRLLAERFHLKMHTETQVKPVYALVQAKGGVKLKPVDAPPLNADQEAVDAWEKGDNWTAENAPPGTFLMTGSTWVGKALPISQLLIEIAANAQVDRLVVDETGLKGSYDFTFKPSYDKDAPILLDQIESQLGLKLEPRKLPVTTYVIDSVEKPSVDGAELVVGHLAVSGPVAMGQVGAATGAKAPMFEVASIKPNNSGSPGVAWGVSRTGYNANNVPLARVILDAYLVAPTSSTVRPPLDRVKGAPAWVMNAPYDITAKTDDATIEAMKGLNQAQRMSLVAPMLRAMLEDRFKLVVHTMPIDVPGYALVVGKHGIKMKESPPGEPMPANGMSFGGSWKTVSRRTADGRQSGNAYLGITMAELTAFIGSGVTPVVDQTGLTGKYDVELAIMDMGSPGGGDGSAPTPSTTVLQN